MVGFACVHSPGTAVNVESDGASTPRKEAGQDDPPRQGSEGLPFRDDVRERRGF